MADPASVPVALPALGPTIGAAYLGLIASSILFGTSNVQVFLYFINYPKDWLIQKLAVALIWFLDALHSALTIHMVYHYVIESFGNFLALDPLVWSFKLQIAVNIVTIVLVQSMYALRVWRLAHQSHPIMTWIVVATVAAGYAVGIIVTVKTYSVDTFSEVGTISWAVYTSFSTSTVVDVIIAAVMLFYLQKSRSEFSATNSMVVSIMRYILASGLATSICSLVALITYATMPNNLVFLGVEFLLTKLYVNSWMAMLNARQSIREQGSIGTQSISITRMMHIRTDAPSTQVQQVGSGLDKEEFALSPMDHSVDSIRLNDMIRSKKRGVNPNSTLGTTDEIHFKSADSNMV